MSLFRSAYSDGDRLEIAGSPVRLKVHARARRVHIALRFGAATGVRLDVEDDGAGFDVEATQADPRRGIGLRNMRERLGAIDGQLDVRSGAGRTTITAEVPAASARAEGATA